MSTVSQPPFDNHEFRPRDPSDSRSPCPALNALANHGYIPRNGRGFNFFQLIQAIILVYNISYPLAFLLASVGFLTCGKLHIFPLPSWTLDLQSLSHRGSLMIAHDGSLVHPDGEPSTAPDPTRLKELLQQASTVRNSKGDLKGGLDFFDIVRIRIEHVLSTAHPKLSEYHDQISQGECSLVWEVLRDREGTLDGVIPTFKLQQWLGEERLPDGWWCSRPKETIGLLQARKTAKEVAKLSKRIADEAVILYKKEYHWN